MFRLPFLLPATNCVPGSDSHPPGGRPQDLPHAGAATTNITPWLGDGLVGNFGTPPPAKDVHDELYARCFVLDGGSTRIALVVNDNIYISREVLDDAKRQVTDVTGLPEDRMLMSCTHTH